MSDKITKPRKRRVVELIMNPLDIRNIEAFYDDMIDDIVVVVKMENGDEFVKEIQCIEFEHIPEGC